MLRGRVAGRRLRRTVVVLATAAVILSGCGEETDEGGTSAGGGPEVSDGYELDRAVATGLDRPTQMIVGPDGRLWVAQLAGGENEGQGQVVAIAMPGEDVGASPPEVLLEDLDKPTGIAVVDGDLWVQQRRSLLRAPLSESAVVGDTTVVLDDLPFNGRSEGTLTPLPDGRLLYETSGRRAGARAQEGSGMLWALDPDRPHEPEAVARGLKNAYGHTVLPDGSIVATDVLEALPGVTPEDEVNLIVPGEDYGWPRCTGMQAPVADLDVTDQECETTRAPLALLGTSATPTSVVLAPWDDGELLVTRWRDGDVISLRLGGDGERRIVVAGLDGPQHLLVVDGTVLLAEHGTGQVHRLRRAGG